MTLRHISSVRRPTPGCTEKPDPGASAGVVFLARDLNVGGAERVFTNYVNFSEAVRPVVALRRREGGLLGDLDPAVPLFDLTASGSVGSPEGSFPSEASVSPAAPTGVTVRSLAQVLQECYRLRRITRLTGCRMVSSFLMRSHIIALLTKRWLDSDLQVVVNVHEHMSESAEHLYPTRLDRTLMRHVTRRWFPAADRIVAVSESVRADLIETFGLPHRRIALIHNPIDFDRIRALAAEEAPECEGADGPILLGAGRLVPLKGFSILIRAVSQLPPQLGARLLLVGDGPQRAELTALVSRLGLSDRVQFLGEHANPWKYMARATIVVHPSRTEAFPNVIGEGLALGVPVVATECSAGIREYLDGGRCGVLVPPDDPTALAAALQSLLADEELRAQFVARGLRRVETFELKQIVRRYEAVLVDVRTNG